MKERFLMAPYSIGLQNNSAYRELFSNVILRLREDGLLDRWKQIYWPKRKLCGDTTAARTLTIKDIQGIFYVTYAFLSAAFIVLILENIYAYFIKPHVSRWKADLVKHIGLFNMTLYQKV